MAREGRERPRDRRDPNDLKCKTRLNCAMCKATCRNPAAKNYGKRCPNPAGPSGYCHMHGNRNLVAKMAIKWFPDRGRPKPGEEMTKPKYGRMIYLPEEWLDDFASFMEDKELKLLDQDLALIEVLMKTKTEEIKTSGNLDILTRLRGLCTQAMGSGKNARAALEEMSRSIDAAMTGPVLEKDLVLLLEQRRKIIETDAKKSAQEATTLRIEQAKMLVMALIAGINQSVHDAKMLQNIRYSFAKALGAQGLEIPGVDPRQFVMASLKPGDDSE